MILIYTILATLFISLLSLAGVLLMGLKKDKLTIVVLYLVSLSAGTLLGASVFHLLPESLELLNVSEVFNFFILSFISFLVLELLLNWHHCHNKECNKHSLGYLNLIAEVIHNFIDGFVIASAFLINPVVGISTTLAIALHEIPQEIGDFGILIHSGFSKNKAILLNLLVSLTAVIGGIVGFYLTTTFNFILPYLLAIAAGSFMYISTSDLIPEIKHHYNINKSLKLFLMFFLGLFIMFLTRE